VSWWVSGSLVSLGFLAIGTWFKHHHDLYRQPQVGIGVAAAWMILQLLGPPWQWVGIWRSAHNHLRATRKWLWATLAQILVVMSGISWACSTPLLLAMWTKSAVLQHRFSHYHVRLVNGERELDVRGPIGYRLAETVQQTLDRVPTVTRIRLNSPGGLMEEGRKLHDLIRVRHLDTYSDTGCWSACTLAFVAGKERTVHARAKLGFHRPCVVGVEPHKLRQELELQQRYYTSAGVEKEFVLRVQHTPPDEIWFPSREELRQAGVITHPATQF